MNLGKVSSELRGLFILQCLHPYCLTTSIPLPLNNYYFLLIIQSTLSPCLLSSYSFPSFPFAALPLPSVPLQHIPAILPLPLCPLSSYPLSSFPFYPVPYYHAHSYPIT